MFELIDEDEEVRDYLSPVELFKQLDRLLEEVLREGRKEIHKIVLERFSLEERMRPGTDLDLIIALNVGHYMQSTLTWQRITKAMRRFDDAHQIRLGRAVRTENELWDMMGSFLLTAVKGFCEKKRLNPRLPADVPFLDLIS